MFYAAILFVIFNGTTQITKLGDFATYEQCQAAGTTAGQMWHGIAKAQSAYPVFVWHTCVGGSLPK